MMKDNKIDSKMLEQFTKISSSSTSTKTTGASLMGKGREGLTAEELKEAESSKSGVSGTSESDNVLVQNLD